MKLIRRIKTESDCGPYVAIERGGLWPGDAELACEPRKWRLSQVSATPYSTESGDIDWQIECEFQEVFPSIAVGGELAEVPYVQAATA